MRPVTVLAILRSPADQQSLERIIRHSNWRLRFASNINEARAALGEGMEGVAISERLLPTGENWTDFLAALHTAPVPPPLIVVESDADAVTWTEVLNLGGYDVLMKPFDHTEVVRTISTAWLWWKHRSEHGRAVRERPALRPGIGGPHRSLRM